MANFRIIVQDPTSTMVTAWDSGNRQRVIRQARLEHSKGANVTVYRKDTGNIVFWLGRNLRVDQSSKTT